MAKTTKSDTLELQFTKERETKNTVRFSEDGKQQAIGTLYVQKSALAKIGDPEALSVTIEPV